MTPQVLLLMAGQGSRFRAGGYAQSKALIPVAGRPMFEHALSGIEGVGDIDLFAVVRSDQITGERIDEEIRRIRPAAVVVELPRMTRGAAESALGAAETLDPARPLVVLDCDLRFRSADYLGLIDSISAGSSMDVGLLTFPASDPRYSFARVAEDGRVVEVAEKRVISDRAIAGAYLFRTAGAFVDVARDVVAGGLHDRLPEFYLSAVVQELLRRGAVVRAATVDEYESFGTPEELDLSLQARHAV